MKTAKDVLKLIKDQDVKYVDLRFTDPRGKWQHVTFDVGMVDEDMFAEGTAVVASGRLQDDVFVGDEVLAKHDETYMPREVKAALDKGSAAAAYGR